MDEFTSIIEAHYPITFREEESQVLGKHLRARHSVALVGMKRVGISNFLRFFLYHKNTGKKYINDGGKHLFITVDLNDLVERELYPFWILTLKRIVDATEKSTLSAKDKKRIESLFLGCIQSQDLFFAIDSVRRALGIIVRNDVLPTIFFIRFDRIKEAASVEFFSNLEGLREAMHQRLSYVFTSFRSLNELAPSVFTKTSLPSFSQNMYIIPTKAQDTEIIYKVHKDKYKLNLSKDTEKSLLQLVDGYVQYLQLAVIILSEKEKTPKDKKELLDLLLADERISLQSEELWESLAVAEKAILLKFIRGEKLTTQDREGGSYLFETGLLTKSENNIEVFSPLFRRFLEEEEQKSVKNNHLVDFTKKEHTLFAFLQKNINEICEREKIIEKVWSEEEAFGVTDWAIDRLVARVRNKLELQKSDYEIQTVKTRGYKLIKT